MQTEEKIYTISVFTENIIGILNRITVIFTRRRYNIESLTVSESEVPGVHRYTITIQASEANVKKLVQQVEKQIDVLKAFYNDESDIIYQEIALFKVPLSALMGSTRVESLIRNHNARILEIEPEYVAIEKTGLKEETQLLLKELEPYGVLEFVRSGRVAIRKPMKEFRAHLKELEIESGIVQN